VWWIKLGIRPERIVAGRPQQNGRHERVHRTLNQETAVFPAATLPAQQQLFDGFRAVYNHERPHEVLRQQTPASRYRPSPRRPIRIGSTIRPMAGTLRCAALAITARSNGRAS
jgi:transposase InsO family protein